jgi:hypothetical protein
MEVATVPTSKNEVTSNNEEVKPVFTVGTRALALFDFHGRSNSEASLRRGDVLKTMKF